MELGSNFLSGLFIAGLFLVKVWLLVFWVNYVGEEAQKEYDKEVSKNKIYFNAFKKYSLLSSLLF